MIKRSPIRLFVMVLLLVPVVFIVYFYYIDSSYARLSTSEKKMYRMIQEQCEPNFTVCEVDIKEIFVEPIDTIYAPASDNEQPKIEAEGRIILLKTTFLAQQLIFLSKGVILYQEDLSADMYGFEPDYVRNSVRFCDSVEHITTDMLSCRPKQKNKVFVIKPSDAKFIVYRTILKNYDNINHFYLTRTPLVD